MREAMATRFARETRIKRSYTIDDMRRMAVARGGRCLSEGYRNQRMLLTWACALGHVWQSTANNVLRHSWCPECRRARLKQIQHRKRLGTPVPVLEWKAPSGFVM
jgi:hypothetical protein